MDYKKNYEDDLELDLSELLVDQDDHFEGNDFGFLDRRKVRNVFVAS
jgi:hypothetical protein